jgi:uncharacterized protein YcaQ
LVTPAPDSEITLKRSEARRFLLLHQRLWPPRALEGEDGVLSFIKRVRRVQSDPLDVVGHNQELVLQARVRDFTAAMWERLLYDKRALVDGWDKQMSIYPTEDWPWAPARGARAALEGMFLWGELVIHHKVHTRKVYDLSARHIPRRIFSAPDPNRTENVYRDWHVVRRIRSVGLLWDKPGAAWLEIPGVKSAERNAALKRLRHRGKAMSLLVEGISARFFLSAEERPLLEEAVSGSRAAEPRACILAPLDNLLWDRGMFRALFDFDFVWEVYKKPHLRRYGYYVLPVLYGDRFIGTGCESIRPNAHGPAPLLLRFPSLPRG